jgi:hypothetical protein
MAEASGTPEADGIKAGELGPVAEKDREMTESEVQYQLRRLGIAC